MKPSKRSILTITTILAISAAVLVSTTPASAKQEGWFIGAGFSMFEMSGSGDLNTLNGTIDFNVERNNAYGLVTNDPNIGPPLPSKLGLGWDGSQLPGGKLIIGYRHNFHFVTHLDMYWALPKSAELYGAQPTVPDVYSLTQQTTQWRQRSVRLMLDWTPFEPLPLWFFQFGLDYTSFNSRLEFRFERQEGVGSGSETFRIFESYEDGGSAVGAVIGTGLQMASGADKRQEWYIALSYAWVPFSDSFYAWDADFLIGGAAFEGGLRIFLGSGEDD